MAELKSILTAHDLALEAGAFMDTADPEIGIPHDCYVFTRAELARFLQLVSQEMQHASLIYRTG